MISDMTTTTTPADMAAAVRAAREERGWSYDTAAIQFAIKYPGLRVTRGKLVRFEAGRINVDRLDFGFIAALSAMYGIPLEGFGDEVAAEAEAIKRLLEDPVSPCSPDTPPYGGLALASGF